MRLARACGELGWGYAVWDRLEGAVGGQSAVDSRGIGIPGA